MKKIKKSNNKWGTWRDVDAATILKAFRGFKVEQAKHNNVYIAATMTENTVLGNLKHVMVSRMDKRAVTSQEDMYKIKKDLFGNHSEAMVWLYGADRGDHRPVIAHMFVSNVPFPFGPKRLGHAESSELSSDEFLAIINGLGSAMSALMISVSNDENMKFGFGGALRAIEASYDVLAKMEEQHEINKRTCAGDSGSTDGWGDGGDYDPPERDDPNTEE